MPGAFSGWLPIVISLNLPTFEIDPRVNERINKVSNDVHDEADEREYIKSRKDDRIVSFDHAFEAQQTKAIEGDDLIDAVRRVNDGDAVFSPRLAGFVLDAFSADLTSPADPELDQLTAREQEVMRLLARGYAYKEIARRLTISIKTVETHASSVLRKLQLSSRNELAMWAANRRIV